MPFDHTDLEDDYADYLQETWGYAWDAWDVLAADAIRRHDRLLEPELEIDAVDLASLTNFERWALVLRAKDSKRLECLRLIISSPEDATGLNLGEVFEFAVRAFSDEELFDEAHHVEQLLAERWPEYHGLRLVRLYRELREGGSAERAVAKALEDVDDSKLDPWIEVAEELLLLGRVAHARDVAERARTLAIERDDRPTRLDIDLMLEQIALRPEAGTEELTEGHTKS